MQDPGFLTFLEIRNTWQYQAHIPAHLALAGSRVCDLKVETGEEDKWILLCLPVHQTMSAAIMWRAANIAQYSPGAMRFTHRSSPNPHCSPWGGPTITPTGHRGIRNRELT